MVPMMPVFLRGRILLGIDDAPCQGALKRTVAHGDLPGVAAHKVGPRAAHALGRGATTLIERQAFSGNRHGFVGPSVQPAHLRSPLVATTRDRSWAVRPPCGSASALSRAKARAQWRAQYGLPATRCAPQKKNSLLPGSPTGQQQVAPSSSIKRRR